MDRNIIDDLATTFYTPVDQYEEFDLSVPDDRLAKLIIDSLDGDRDYWNRAPFNLEAADTQNIAFLLGDQMGTGAPFVASDDNADHVDNRLFSSVRAILSYAAGRLAVPELTPSRGDRQYVNMARDIQNALYQHSVDENVEQKVRAALTNLLTRKRGPLKLRYDPNAGMYGDLITDVVSPDDIILDRYAGFMQNPRKVYHRLRCTLDELCAKFPKKANAIYSAYSIKRGTFGQLSLYVTYYECWFTYSDKGKPREGVAWFINDPVHMILDKQPNPNWVYTGDDKKDMQTNVTSLPPKPFVFFNYLNLGRSAIDETCLFEQAKPLQKLLNKRNLQWHKNIDYVNGRWVADTNAMDQGIANQIVNKGSKTVAMIDASKAGGDVRKAFANVASASLPAEVYESIIDARNEIDVMMGTPSQFRGETSSQKNTLGRDVMVKQQAGMLQDDLVRSIEAGMGEYYKIKLQMMRTYYTDDYSFEVKGGDGKYDFIMLSGDTIDTNVKISVQTDSTLPLDKASIRATAESLLTSNKIDYLTAMEDMGMPDPEVRTERFMRSQIDPIGYMNSVVQSQDNDDAEMDINLLIAGRQPVERDTYDENYLNFFNNFLTENRFAQLDQSVKQQLIAFLAVVQHIASQQATLQASMLDDADITNAPITPPAPKKTVQMKLTGAIDPNTSQTLTGVPPTAPAQAQPPVK